MSRGLFVLGIFRCINNSLSLTISKKLLFKKEFSYT